MNQICNIAIKSAAEETAIHTKNSKNIIEHDLMKS